MNKLIKSKSMNGLHHAQHASERRSSNGKPNAKGYFTLLLHTHQPFAPLSEESEDIQQFYRFMTLTLLPFLELISRLITDHVNFRFAMTMSPILSSMLENEAIMNRYSLQLQQTDETNFNFFESLDRKVLPQLKLIQDLGYLEILTCAASHAYLPLIKTEESLKVQISTAVKDYKHHFGREPRGCWLPECGYTIGVDRILKQYGIDYFVVDSIAIKEANPRPNRLTFAPLMTPYGVQAFARDHDSSNQICSGITGYPRDSEYRFGYHNDENAIYDPPTANAKAKLHATHFVQQRIKQVEFYAESFDRKPHVFAPFDLRWFGERWTEGIIFLEYVCRQIHIGQTSIEMLTPSEYLSEYPIADTAKLKESSWEHHSTAESLLNDKNEWIYKHLHQAEERMIRIATNFTTTKDLTSLEASKTKRALKQCGRTFMLAQSSDWATLMNTSKTSAYAITSFKDLLGCFHQLAGMIETNTIDFEFLQALEQRHSLFSHIDVLDFVSISNYTPVQNFINKPAIIPILETTNLHPNIFMLTWEYPPKSVGGLSVAVRDLSEALAKQGKIVHVLTSSDPGLPNFEIVNGVHVHRLPIMYSYYTDFYHWQFEMNLAMIDHLIAWKQAGGRIDLIHAHDWMVYTAAREIKMSFNVPMVATIHATEWGRNQGVLYSDLQKRIHKLELQLTNEADKVFVCSDYMKNEVQHVFGLNPGKVEIIHNGVPLPVEFVHDLTLTRKAFTPYGEKMIFYVGRLVFEKGVQSLIDAMPAIINQIPNAKLIIAGTGSMESELKSRASYLGNHVKFLGYIDDQKKNELFQIADVCVIPSFYEPFGIVALETMRYRRPLVISDTGGMKELIEHGIEGYKALPGNPESLTYHIVDLINDQQKGQKMAERAYQKLERHYGWAKIATHLTEEYRKLQVLV